MPQRHISFKSLSSNYNTRVLSVKVLQLYPFIALLGSTVSCPEPRLYTRVCPSIGQSVVLFWAGRDKPVNDLLHVCKLVQRWERADGLCWFSAQKSVSTVKKDFNPLSILTVSWQFPFSDGEQMGTTVLVRQVDCHHNISGVHSSPR